MEIEVERQVDWFAINLDEFNKAYQEAREASIEAVRLEAAMEACQERRCGHPPFKKDGTSDKRYACDSPDAVGFEAMVSMNHITYEYSQLWDFFERIGLPLTEGALMSGLAEEA